MVLDRIRDMIQGEPTLPPGPIHLPDYFPVEPIGCEKKTQALFQCLIEKATPKHRELEGKNEHDLHYQIISSDKNEQKTPEKDPLEPCRSVIAHYKRCCDRELKRKRNWRLTELYRVQEEYRYKPKDDSSPATGEKK